MQYYKSTVAFFPQLRRGQTWARFLFKDKERDTTFKSCHVKTIRKIQYNLPVCNATKLNLIFFPFMCVCVFVIIVVVVVMMVLAVVVMIVLVVVVDGSRSGCDSVGGCVLFSFIHTYSKVQFILSNAICQSTKNKKQLKNVWSRLHPSRTLSYCLRKGNAVLHLCQLFLEFFDIF